MVPRTEIIAVDMDVELDELKNAFIAHGISKVIVYKGSIDQIIGYIHSSDLFKNQSDWHKSIRPIPIVPETMSAHKLMQLFCRRIVRWLWLLMSLAVRRELFLWKI